MLFQLEYKNEDSNKTIQKYVNSQLIPIVDELENLAISALRLDVSFFGIVSRRHLGTLNDTYRDKAKQFLTLYHIFLSPDKLFADLKLDPQKDAKKILELRADYENSKDLVEYHMKRGFRMIELLQSQMDRQYTSSDQRLVAFISAVAVTVAFLSLIVPFAQ
jgi:hypothetical protein